MTRSLSPTPHLSTRQHWVLLAVADRRIDRDPRYGGLCTVDGHCVSWAVASLALRGLVAFDPLLSGLPRLTRRGQAIVQQALVSLA